MTSDKQLLSAIPRQYASRTERRSQSDTAINVTTRVLPKAPTKLLSSPLPLEIYFSFSFITKH